MTAKLATDGAGRRQVDGLAQVHLAGGVMLHHNGIIEGDQLLALDVHQLPPHQLGLLGLGKTNHHQTAHHTGRSLAPG